ncbi:MAG TPA: thioredoxin family protein [Candidatus Paceibacterota bacterium]|nr:thioredoxin family protein [Candidatus Paceibacterota bacterium]
MRSIDWKKYLFVLVITVSLFGTALYVSSRLNDRRIDEIRSIGDQISIDILSSETQFSLLAESSCKDLAGQSILSKEINSLAEKLSYTEERLGSDNPEVIELKRYYSLLEIKDYLLMKRVSAKCGTKPITVLYFYSNDGACTDCEKAGYVLTALRERYPDLRVYSFDYHLNLSALRTLISIFNIEPRLPAIMIGDEVFYGFTPLEEIEAKVPELAESLATSTSTSTPKR